MSYADIILPVPLNSLFTYAIPTDMAESVAFGKRVLVSFGPKNHYVGIIVRLHDNKPTTYKVKPIEQVLDDTPLLLESQLRLWQWIADYYMSPIGDVYKGALPAGLKAEDRCPPQHRSSIML